MGLFFTIACAVHFNEHFDNPSSVITGAVVSVFAGGAFFGSALAGWLADRFGRKRTIQVGAAIGCVGCALQTAGATIGMLIGGRVIAGFSVGVLSMVGPLYQAEIAPPAHRGLIVGIAQQMIGIGFIIANWVGYGCQYLNSDAQWRVPLGVQIIPAGLLFIGASLLPFSPRWLIEQGREDEALAVIKRLHYTGANDDFIDREFLEMRDQIRFEKQHQSRSIAELVATGPMIRRTLVACGVQIMGQNTGINVINYFGPQFYTALGVQGSQLLLVNGLYGIVGPITNFIFIVFILDRVGRTRPLWLGSFGIAATLSVGCALTALFPPDSGGHETAQRTGVAMYFLTSIIFSLSYGPISWVYVSEVFPMRVRAMGNAVATMSNWAFNVLYAQCSPIALSNIGWRYYIVFIVLNILSSVLVYFFFPETNGKSLEEIDEVFGDQKISHALDSSPPMYDRKEEIRMDETAGTALV